MALLAPERHDRILALLARDGTVSVQQLADSFAVTRETVRRDLDQLEADGALRRIHGGAVAASTPSRAESSLQERLARQSDQKLRIAQAALAYLPPETGGSMIIDAGGSLTDRIWYPTVTAHQRAPHRPAAQQRQLVRRRDPRGQHPRHHRSCSRCADHRRTAAPPCRCGLPGHQWSRRRVRAEHTRYRRGRGEDSPTRSRTATRTAG